MVEATQRNGSFRDTVYLKHIGGVRTRPKFDGYKHEGKRDPGKRGAGSAAAKAGSKGLQVAAALQDLHLN